MSPNSSSMWRVTVLLLLAVAMLSTLASPFSLHAPAAAEGPTLGVTATPVAVATPKSTPSETVPRPESDRGDPAKSGGLFFVVEGNPLPTAEVETVTSRLVGIDFEQLASVADSLIGLKNVDSGDPPTPKRLVLNLFEDVVFTGIVEHVEPTASGYALWGSLEGLEMGTVTLVVNGPVVVGTVRTLDEVYSIRTVGDGAYVIRQIDESTLPPPGEPLEPALTPRDNGDDTDNLPPDDGSEIDVMVVYTPLARRQQGGRAAIEALIDLLVAETNQAYENSGVIHRIRLVLREEVDYVEDGDSSIDLHRLANYPDPYMDHIHTLRDRYSADLVHILVGRGDVAGTAQRGENLA